MKLTPLGINQGDLHQVLLALSNQAYPTTVPNLAPGTVTTNLKHAAFQYRLNGAFKHKAAADPTTALPAAVNTGPGAFRKVRVEIDAAGAVSYAVGDQASAQERAPMPRRSANKVTLGWIEVPASFTAGTTPLTAAMLKDGDPDVGDGSLAPFDRGIDPQVLTGP